MTIETIIETTIETSAIVIEAPKTPRNFRSAVDIESFYRFVNDNDLRKEAKIMFELIQQRVMGTVKRKRKEKTKKVH
jgi:hypothetical protein